MGKLGFAEEERFMSHCTIARIKYIKDKIGFKKQVSEMGVKDMEFKVNCFKLIESELSPKGPLYIVIEEYPLSL